VHVRMEDMSWSEVRDALRAGFDKVLLVLGSIEQHGPHLPLGTDTLLGYAWGEAMARELDGTLLAPVMRPGLSQHHLGFPGTLTLDEPTFQSVIEQVSVSLAQTGFRTVIPFCSHGGNWPSLFGMRKRLECVLSGRAKLVLLSEDVVAGIEGKIYTSLRLRGVSEGVAGIHAGLRETSHVLAISSSAVRREAAVRGWIGDSAVKVLSRGTPIAKITETGVFGDATVATEQLGAELNALTVRLYVEAFREAMATGNMKRQGS